MKRRARRGRALGRDSRHDRRLFNFKLRVEQLEPRRVLSQLAGAGLAATSPGNLAGDTLLVPSIRLLQPDTGTDSQTDRVSLEPRQLPGSNLHFVPLADMYRIDPVIVAGDLNGTPPDSPGNRVDPNTPDSLFAGVGSLKVKVGSSNYVCTATAISPIHVITAAHCLDVNANGTIDPSPANVTFNVNIGPGSGSTYQITADQLYVHPDWTGFENPVVNDDVAIVELSSELPADVPIYALNEQSFDDSVAAYFVGYGRSGDGVNGYTTNASYTVKRWGMNDDRQLLAGRRRDQCARSVPVRLRRAQLTRFAGQRCRNDFRQR